MSNRGEMTGTIKTTIKELREKELTERDVPIKALSNLTFEELRVMLRVQELITQALIHTLQDNQDRLTNIAIEFDVRCMNDKSTSKEKS